MIKSISLSFRKQLLPAEHGSWFWLLLPFITGVLIGYYHFPQNKQGWVSTLFLFLGMMALFLLRRPISSLIRNWRRATKIKRETKQWTIFLIVLGLISFTGLIWQQQYVTLVMAAPALIAFSLYIIAAQFGRWGMRSLPTELMGVTVLALTAPAALAIWEGYLSETSWELWAIITLQNSLSIFYIRHRLSLSTKEKTVPLEFLRTTHTVGLLLILLGITALALPPLTILPFIFYFVRIIWVTAEERPIEDIKQFGFLEAGITIVATIIYIIAYI